MASGGKDIFDDLDRYSERVHREFYVGKPGYFSVFHPRIHRHAQLSTDATIQCQIDLFGKESIGKVMGNLDTYCGDWTSLVYPFCYPDRLALTAYMVDFAFIHDDVDYEETIQTKKYEEGSESCDQALKCGNYSPEWLNEARNKQVIAKTMCKLVETDHELGLKFIQQWENWKRSEKEFVQKEAQTCDSLQKFLKLCYYMRGCQWAFAMARFAYKLRLTEEEEAIVRPMTELIMEVLTLHNDYYSWEKETAFYNASEDKLPMSNSVTLYMQWYSLPPEEAKEAIKKAAVEKEQQYLEVKKGFINRQLSSSEAVPSAVSQWLNIMEHMVAGNLLWSLTCPRYHGHARNQYRDYYQLRCRQGHIFADDCTRAETFTGLGLSESAEVPAPYPLCSSSLGGITTDKVIDRGHSSQHIPPLFFDSSLKQAEETVIAQPFNYINSLPSKRVRETFVDALNTWFHAPDRSVNIIRGAIGDLHRCSLMLDDIQDGSFLRRGMPAAHVIYGPAQAMNSAYYLCINALESLHTLSNSAISIYIDEVRMLHLGQAQELYWTYHSSPPSEEEYVRMIDGKTTSLFRMASRMLLSEASQNRGLDLGRLISLLGRFFQIRDDYQNLASVEYSDQKGFCEDLDEGKFSLPLIHALTQGDAEIESILEQRKRHGQLSYELKRLVLDRLRLKGSLDYTLSVLRELQESLRKELARAEAATQQKNWVLQLLLFRLKM
ncbi:isoprenoid synthase domain-containing protein [Aspergillus alliaceus]|uniref:Isoprenoid synthase domain-containing protein n=1 Tax=Petromyces alliaceus TaxID=209559 RepID=A0A5N7CCR5_PETAA|nr:isoprenoid synthase domain-containing protein [Aspergillus alliaceus]